MKKNSIEVLDECFSGYYNLSQADRFLLVDEYVNTLYPRADEDFAYPLLIVTAIAEGTDPKTLSEFLALPLDFVAEVADRLTTSGLWSPDGSVDYEFLTARSEKQWDCYFMVALFIARGYVAWTGALKNGRRVYRITDAGYRAHLSRMSTSPFIN